MKRLGEQRVHALAKGNKKEGLFFLPGVAESDNRPRVAVDKPHSTTGRPVRRSFALSKKCGGVWCVLVLFTRATASYVDLL